MTLDLSPAPGAAPLPAMIRAQAAMEARLMLRNGEQLLIAVIIPLLVLFGGVLAADELGLDFARSPVDTLTPGVIALAVMSTSFASLAIATGFERRYGVLKRLGASPLPRSGLLLGKAGALLLVEAVQVVVIAAAAVALGWRPETTVPALLAALLTLVIGTLAFAAFGLFVAGVMRAEATLAVANLVYLLLLAGGAVVFPASSYGAAGELLTYLPSGALGAGMRAALLDGEVPVTALTVLAVWAAVGSVLTARFFRWE